MAVAPSRAATSIMPLAMHGRASDVPWAMVFPDAASGPLPRHPSQIYEAITEGLILFLVLLAGIYRWKALKRPGAVSSVFLLGYGLARCFCEFFREDTDPKIGLSLMTSGQIYSLPLIILGAGYLCWIAWHRDDRVPV